ncbi:MAG: hypothetical protein U5K31_03950 [Balneolaceae bacterium]|nr:hypothetical protein [Balneolaceae bacterium]
MLNYYTAKITSFATLRHALGAILFIFLLLAGFSYTTHAQDNIPRSSSASAEVSANILEINITLVTLRDIQFDRVQPSQGIISVNPVSNSNAGLMMADGSPNTPISVRFQRQVTLVHQTGVNTLQFEYQLSGYSERNQSASELVAGNSQNFRLNEDGEFYIWVGGRVDITNAVSGNYEGDLTVEVEYI